MKKRKITPQPIADAQRVHPVALQGDQTDERPEPAAGDGVHVRDSELRDLGTTFAAATNLHKTIHLNEPRVIEAPISTSVYDDREDRFRTYHADPDGRTKE